VDLVATARAEADAMLEEARRAAATADLEIAERRWAAEHADADRHEVARRQTEQLVADAEAHAAEAEQRVVRALEQAERVRRDAAAQAQELLAQARQTADRVVDEARQAADRAVDEARTEAERERTTAQTEVAELGRQREAVAAYLDELRSVLGDGTLSGREALDRASRAGERFRTPPAARPDVPGPDGPPDAGSGAGAGAEVTVPDGPAEHVDDDAASWPADRPAR
jgi:hypothetical protein